MENNRARARELESADITELYEHFAKTAVGIVNEGRECHSQLALIKMDDAEPGKIEVMGFIEPDVVNMLQKSSTTKDLLMALIVKLLKGDLLSPSAPFVPDVVVHVSEAWVVSRAGAMPADVKETIREVCEECDQLRDHPERTEGLFIAVHTSDRTFLGMCPITGEGAERRAEFKPLHQGRNVGRMTMNEDSPHGTH